MAVPGIVHTAGVELRQAQFCFLALGKLCQQAPECCRSSSRSSLYPRVRRRCVQLAKELKRRGWTHTDGEWWQNERL